MPKRSTLIRTQARELKEKMYFTGVPCKRGHISVRYTATAKCRDCHKDVLSKRYRQNRQQVVHQHMLCNAKKRAQAFHVPFDISADDILAVWPKDNLCPVFGTPLVPADVHLSPESPTVDRFQPALGYVKGNISVLSFRANLIKGSETDPEVFRKVADWVAGRR